MRRRKWTLLLVTALTLGSALFYSYRQDPLYTSTARVLVKPLNPSLALGGYNYNSLISMQTESALAQSPAVGREAAAIVEAEGGSPRETGDVSVENPVDTTFLDLAYTDGDPARAQAWAQAYAQGYMHDREKQALAAYRSAASGYDQTIADLQVESAQKRDELLAATTADERRLAREQLDTLQQQLTVVQAQRAQLPIPAQDSAQILDPAGLPGNPSSPNHLQDSLLGLIAGLALGLGLAFVRERMDDRLAGREDLEAQIGAPTLAIVPSVPGWRRRKTTHLVIREAPTGPSAEAYRTIRANLQFLAREGDVKILTITSPSLGEGKTTTTADLAVTLAGGGKRVIAMSCDLRKPRLHAFFGLPNEPGLTELLRGEASLGEITQRCGVESLRVVASGRSLHNPAELLASEAMATLLRQLRNYADFILIDTPPVLAVADALLLASQSDATIIVVDASRTARSAVAPTRVQLEQVGARILGGVLNNLDPARAKYYPAYVRQYYGYGYGDGKRARESTNGRQPNQQTTTPEDVWRT